MKPAKMAAEFAACPNNVGDVHRLGKGNINDTYLVRCKSGKIERFILQRLNPTVFTDPAGIMANLLLLRNHLAARSNSAGLIPAVIADRAGNDFRFDHQGAAWRALSYIEGDVLTAIYPSRSSPPFTYPDGIREAGRMLGSFHHLTADLPVAALNDPLPGLHDTPTYLRQYDGIKQNPGQRSRSGDIRFCAGCIDSRRELATILVRAEKQGILKQRLIHGDPKLDNILFDPASGRALALIDLDTVKPGLLLYDLGDFLRSACNIGGEDLENPDEANFDLDLFRAALTGCREAGNRVMTTNDLRFLYEAIRLIPFELGLRFFTDYLKGNVYFKTEDDEQNLRRALVQFRLTECVEKREREIRSIIASV